MQSRTLQMLQCVNHGAGQGLIKQLAAWTLPASASTQGNGYDGRRMEAEVWSALAAEGTRGPSAGWCGLEICVREEASGEEFTEEPRAARSVSAENHQDHAFTLPTLSISSLNVCVAFNGRVREKSAGRSIAIVQGRVPNHTLSDCTHTFHTSALQCSWITITYYLYHHPCITFVTIH